MMSHEPNVHVARFRKQHCEIEVGVGCSAHGPLLVFVAEAFVADRGHALRRVVRSTGEAVTIHAESEGYALSGMLRVLERHFGPVKECSAAFPPRDASRFNGHHWPLRAGHRSFLAKLF